MEKNDPAKAENWKISDPAIEKQVRVKNPGKETPNDTRVYGDVYIRLQFKEFMELYPVTQEYSAYRYMADEDGNFISFDPNVRLSLWDDPDSLRNTIHEFIPYAHILKLSDEELEFITGETSLEQALPQLFTGNVQCLIYTRGKDGAVIYHKGHLCGEVEGHSVEAVDTTGAGDSFIGAFLYKLLEDHVDNLETVSSDMLKADLEFANRYAAHTAIKEGAISALATQEELEAFTASLHR